MKICRDCGDKVKFENTAAHNCLVSLKEANRLLQQVVDSQAEELKKKDAEI